MAIQLVLPVRLCDEASFANFHLATANRGAVMRFERFVHQGSGSLYLHGPPGSGRSHLLQAACRALEELDGTFVYLPLELLRDSPPDELLDGLETRLLVCLDDVDAIAGRDAWEEALFHLYNRCLETGSRLLVAAKLPPAQAGFRLADLRSRLQGGEILALARPDDDDHIDALCLRARNRGLVLDRDVARFICSRSRRSMDALLEVLDRLDVASLGAGRRLSIPFVKDVLGW